MLRKSDTVVTSTEDRDLYVNSVIDDDAEVSSSVDESVEFARSHGLIYVQEFTRGFARFRAGKGFYYKDIGTGQKLQEKKHLERIQQLVIPPAWAEVWICSQAKGHLQATGYDKKGRKQYRYHEKWNEVRNSSKFQNLMDFADVLPIIKKNVAKDLGRRGLPKEKVLAAVVEIMLRTQIRIGNDVYAQQNGSYGLTTILNRHVKVTGSKVNFKFKGKSGILHDVTFSDRKLANIVSQCMKLPQNELFCYMDKDGRVRDITSQDVNEYIKEITGKSITAKTIRTWSGTTRALTMVIHNVVLKSEETLSKKFVLQCVQKVSDALRNTKTVCKKYYIHPLVFEPKVISTIKKVFKKKNVAEEVSEGQVEECLKVIIREHT